jgi:hypothetical protein
MDPPERPPKARSLIRGTGRTKFYTLVSKLQTGDTPTIIFDDQRMESFRFKCADGSPACSMAERFGLIGKSCLGRIWF